MELIGTVVSNRYQIIGELGSGGMAWVYLAQDLRDDQLVAVKVLYPQHSGDLSFLRRFMQEAKLAMSLSQCAPKRYIVCVLDYGSDRDTHYLVMEYVRGKDLGQILAEKGSLPWQQALEIARQVAMALDHAHQYEIVHRDIKPGNIMILPDGAVRVLDFGIARARTSPDLTLSGFVGSPHYAAPEQAMGERVDTRADIYSLGVVIYRMLSGELPFQGNTPWAIVNQHIAAPLPPLEEICPDLPAPASRLVQKAMAKRPVDRFQTPAEMVEAIDKVLAGHDLPTEALALRPEATASQLEQLHEHAQQAVEAEAWHKAVDLYSQILKIDPGYLDVSEQLAEAGLQIRLATHCRTARRALQAGRWDEALIQLDKIAAIDPEYKELDELRARAHNREKLESDGSAPPSDYPTQVEKAPAGASLDQIPDRAADQVRGEEQPLAAPGKGERQPRPLLRVALLVLLVALALAGYAIYRISQPAPVAISTATPSVTALWTPTQPASPIALPPATATEPAPTVAPSRTVAPIAATAVGILTITPTPIPSLDLIPTATLSLTLTSAPTPAPRLAGQIAFPRFDPSRGTYDVHVCRVDGSDCRLLVAGASQPDFLPDGSRLVLHSWKADDKGLVVHTLTGERVWKITDRIEAARPSVDWAGELYVYHSRQEADRQPRLYRTYNAETRAIRREASEIVGFSPSWTPDGRILYGGCWQDSCGILVMRSDGTYPRQVVAGSQETNPEASPDGRQVAFMSRRDGNWEVYIANLDGSGLQRLTNNSANDGLPAWSPDGRQLAFVSDREGGWAVWVMDPDGSQPRRLFSLGGPLDGQVQGAAPHEIHGWAEERISWAPLP